MSNLGHPDIISTTDKKGKSRPYLTADFEISDFVDVTDYGAVGDGTTDDTANFQLAVNALSDYQTLRVKGTFRINSPITLKGNATYDFSRAVFYPGASVDSLYLFYGLSLSNIKVIGGRFLPAAFSPRGDYVGGNYINSSAIHFDRCTNVLVKEAYFDEWYGQINFYNCSNCTAIYNTVQDGNGGIQAVVNSLATQDTNNVKINLNTFINNGDDAVSFQTLTGSSINVRNCQAHGNYVSGTDMTVLCGLGFRVNKTGGSGILSNISIKDNKMYDMAGYGIHFMGVEDSEIVGNEIIGYGRYNGDGILVGVTGTGCTNISVLGNKIRDPQKAGSNYAFIATEITDCQISDNDVEADTAAGYGAIFAYDSSSNQITNNKIKNNQANAPAVHTAGTSDNNIVTGNDAVGVTSAAKINLSGTKNIKYGNKWKDDLFQGQADLTGGTVTISTAEVIAADNISLTRVVSAGTPGHLSIGTIVAGTSFVINSSSGTDTSTIFWQIIH